jgi:phospholipid/cholesterol/gamma-HCH transport system substrate-binding protein
VPYDPVTIAKIRVSVMTVVALAILSVIVFLLIGGNIFEPKTTLYTYLKDTSGLGKTSEVRMNGVLVGKIKSVQLAESSDPKRVVRVEMLIPERYLRDIPVDSVTGISAQTLLEDKYIDITPGKSPQHVEPGAELKYVPPLEFDRANLIKSLQTNMAQVDALLASIQAGQGRVGRFFRGEQLYDDVNSRLRQFQQNIDAVGDPKSKGGSMIYTDAAYRELRERVRRFDDSIAAIQGGEGPFGHMLTDTSDYDKLRQAIGNVRKTVEEINAGKGGVGELIKTDRMYARWNQLLDDFQSRVDALNSGSGKMGQLLVSSQMYESLAGSTRQMQELLKEVRTNPQKFLRLKIF